MLGTSQMELLKISSKLSISIYLLEKSIKLVFPLCGLEKLHLHGYSLEEEKGFETCKLILYELRNYGSSYTHLEWSTSSDPCKRS